MDRLTELKKIYLGGASVEYSISVLEKCCFDSITKDDIAGFTKNFIQLKEFYSQRDSLLKMKILGLNLLRLLVEERLCEFYSELELIGDIEHPCIELAIKLAGDSKLVAVDDDIHVKYFIDKLILTRQKQKGRVGKVDEVDRWCPMENIRLLLKYGQICD
ncbi:MAG: putative 26S proteasome non-ATPase regulatory subunit 8-like protein [Hyperionvirus sp.]|uniref:Putative 26S proteasome non-ATPase regulatory subunit 8-like protein n=1 Tax=Hyperionvirus sp. TaxID=2487770 RepID=A0A3G5AFM7_9VIRU|nr:MAG: putative 26S proteasome non-ATPase regulatory subunit 8-like protein [Hyperionvirus sp.]